MDAASRVRLCRWLIAIILGLGPSAAAQTSGDLSDVNRQLKPGDTIDVVEREAGRSRGTFVTASSASLVMSTDGRHREIPAAQIVSVERRGDSVWNGAIIGGLIASYAFAAGAGSSCSPNCSSTVTGAALFGGALGGGVGALIDYLHVGHTLLYRAQPGSESKALAGLPDVAPALDAPSPPAKRSIGNLWERITPGDPVTVRLKDGKVIDGEFVRVSTASLTISTGRHSQEFPADNVQQVVRKHGGNHLVRGLAVGVPIGAVVGSGPCYSVEDDPSGLSCGTAVLIGMAAGGTVGALVGKRVWKRTTVYDAAEDGFNVSNVVRHSERPSTIRIGAFPYVVPHGAGVVMVLAFH